MRTAQWFPAVWTCSRDSWALPCPEHRYLFWLDGNGMGALSAEGDPEHCHALGIITCFDFMAIGRAPCLLKRTLSITMPWASLPVLTWWQLDGSPVRWRGPWGVPCPGRGAGSCPRSVARRRTTARHPGSLTDTWAENQFLFRKVTVYLKRYIMLKFNDSIKVESK